MFIRPQTTIKFDKRASNDVVKMCQNSNVLGAVGSVFLFYLLGKKMLLMNLVKNERVKKGDEGNWGKRTELKRGK